jgi:hypothetical protein
MQNPDQIMPQKSSDTKWFVGAIVFVALFFGIIILIASGKTPSDMRRKTHGTVVSSGGVVVHKNPPAPKADQYPAKTVEKFFSCIRAGNVEAAKKCWCIKGDDLALVHWHITLTRDDLINAMISDGISNKENYTNLSFNTIVKNGDFAEVEVTGEQPNKQPSRFTVKRTGVFGGWKLFQLVAE